MLARRRSKLRRRDSASYRYFQQTCAHVRSQSSRGVASAPVEIRSETSRTRSVTQINARFGESKTVLRFEGDSIAYFWAIEVETAISHKMLREHWQELANALAPSPWG